MQPHQSLLLLMLLLRQQQGSALKLRDSPVSEGKEIMSTLADSMFHLHWPLVLQRLGIDIVIATNAIIL